MKKIYAFTALLLLSGCVTPPIKDGDPFDAKDPIKPVNQQIFAFNLVADKNVIKPVAETYHQAPEEARDVVSNFLSNLGEPENFVNGVLQLDPELALTAFWRFVLNTTYGLAGTRDFAGENGLKEKDTNFGKTLGRYKLDEGAYVVLPIIGPSTVRDTVGKVIDALIDPVGMAISTPEAIVKASANGIVTRDGKSKVIDQLYYESIEPYSATRAAYLQHQAFQ